MFVRSAAHAPEQGGLALSPGVEVRLIKLRRHQCLQCATLSVALTALFGPMIARITLLTGELRQN